MKEFKGQLISKGFKVAIVVSRFNNFITDKLLDGAKDALLRSGAKEEEIDVCASPGPSRSRWWSSACCWARNTTPYLPGGDHPRRNAPLRLHRLRSEQGHRPAGLEFAQPVTYGVITADNTDQAIERAGNKMGNKGFQAAQSAIELLNLFADAKIYVPHQVQPRDRLKDPLRD